MNKKRPVRVWVITIFYLLTAGYTLLSYFLIFSGIIAVNEAQQTYFASLGVFDWITTLLIGVLGLSAAISLFMLRKIAVKLFGIALSLNIALTLIQTFRTNWAEALEGPGLIGVIIGLIILVVILFYAKKLDKQQILS